MEQLGSSDVTSPDLDRAADADQSRIPSDLPQTVGSHQPPIRTATEFMNVERSSNMVPKTSSESDDANESCSYRSNGSSGGESSPSEQNEVGSRSQASPKRSKSGKRKRDRSKLRKGKWTSEEEEYTSRIIHYFSTGLLTLPEGSTLRSYLADKLNCDPMRITKKYAGASCLGRRVYHFRDRVHPSIAEIQVAKVELDHLEQRFRLRVEGGNPAAIAPASLEPPQLASAAPVLQPPAVQSPENLLQSLLLGLSAFQQNTAMPAPPQAAIAPVPAPFASAMAPTPAVPPILAQLLLASAAGNSNAFAANQNPVPVNNTAQTPAVDPNVANWAFTQVATALGPALSQLAAANIKQMQQQQQQQAQLQAHQQQAEQILAHQKAQLQSRIQEQQSIIQQKLLQLQSQGQATSLPVPEQPAQGQQPAFLPSKVDRPSQSQVQELLPPQPDLISQGHGLHYPQRDQPQQRQGQQLIQPEQAPRVEQTMPSEAEQQPQTTRTFQEEKSKVFAAEFKQAYERHLKSLGIEATPNMESTKEVTSIQSNDPTPAASMPHPAKLSQANVRSIPETVDTNDVRRTEEDEEGGTALLGFLSSLRKSYENVLREKQISESSKSELSYNVARAATVTDSNSSQQRDSSVEDSDWNSDKKTDNSSSEDSEKEEGGNEKVKNANVYHNQGPPRKRMKVKRVADVIRKGPSS